MLDEESGELIERRLEHESGEARGFYADLAGRVRVTSYTEVDHYTSSRE